MSGRNVGEVADAEAAIRIALAALEPTYGQARIENEEPGLGS